MQILLPAIVLLFRSATAVINDPSSSFKSTTPSPDSEKSARSLPKNADNKWTHHQRASHEESNDDWNYNSLEKWPHLCANGIRQSPIDISASNVVYDFLNPIEFGNYNEFGTVKVQNHGHGVNVEGFDLWDLTRRPYIFGGGLNGRYYLSQYHFHWAFNGNEGSEHTIYSLHYPAEVTQKYTKKNEKKTFLNFLFGEM